VWCFDIERARAADLKDELQAIWVGRLESVIWRPVGPARSFASAEGSLSLHLAGPVSALSQPVPVPVAVIHPVLRHLPVRRPGDARSSEPGEGSRH
jgi:hypothetical protein